MIYYDVFIDSFDDFRYYFRDNNSHVPFVEEVVTDLSLFLNHHHRRESIFVVARVHRLFLFEFSISILHSQFLP